MAIPGSCSECGSSVPDWRHFRGCSQDKADEPAAGREDKAGAPDLMAALRRSVERPRPEAAPLPPDNQQRAAELLPDALRRYYPDVLDEIAAALDAAEARGGAEALERAYRADRTTVAKLSPVERLTCFVVKSEDLVTRAAALRGEES